MVTLYCYGSAVVVLWCYNGVLTLGYRSFRIIFRCGDAVLLPQCYCCGEAMLSYHSPSVVMQLVLWCYGGVVI